MTLVRNDGRLDLYRQMLRIRLVEERIGTLYAEQEMRCPTHFCIGQEAAPVGISAHLRRDDMVFSNHRSHGHFLAKGGDLKGMVAELYGRETGCAAGKGGSQHLIDVDCGFMGSAPILASTISVGVGAAWAARMDGRDQVTVVYFGDGATEEGTFHEALNFAGTHKLSVLFVCENNLYSVHSALDVRQPQGRPVHSLGAAHGMVGVHGDGNDVDVCYRLGAEAVARARLGQGPTIMEFATYRWREHCGPDEDIRLGYRSAEEFAEWQKRDPVKLYGDRLMSEGLLTDAVDSGLRVDIEREVAEAVAFARASPFPKADALSRFVYPV